MPSFGPAGFISSEKFDLAAARRAAMIVVDRLVHGLAEPGVEGGDSAGDVVFRLEFELFIGG